MELGLLASMVILAILPKSVLGNGKGVWPHAMRYHMVVRGIPSASGDVFLLCLESGGSGIAMHGSMIVMGAQLLDVIDNWN